MARDEVTLDNNARMSEPESTKASWLPLIVVMTIQIQISFNAFNVSIAGITKDLGISATAVGLALTTGTFAMAGFILVGSKVGAKIGYRRGLQIGTIVPTLAALTIALAQNGAMLFTAQALSGASVALAAPALTVMIASSYKDQQQASAIGFLASAIPLAQVVSLLIAGAFASSIGWRWSFALLAAIGVINIALTFTLPVIEPVRDQEIDTVGATLSSTGIVLLSVGFSFLNAWGPLSATDGAPFNIAGLSPAPIALVLGAIFLQQFFRWTRKRMDAGEPVLFNLDVIANRSERAVVACMSIMLFVGTAASFLLPLYMQVVQGFSGIKTSFSIVPYTLSIFVANTLVVRLYDKFAPRQIARVGFIFVAAALVLLATTIRNDWGQGVIILGLVTLGLAQGCIVALVFNTLLSSSPKHLAGDVGAFRGLTHNVSGSAGIAVATTLAVTLLVGVVARDTHSSPAVTERITSEINFDRVDFVPNSRVDDVLAETGATAEEKTAAVEIYSDARLRSLRTTMMVLALLALLAVVPAGMMPGMREPDLTVEDLEGLTGPEPDPATT